jgi:hypothetical protein
MKKAVFILLFGLSSQCSVAQTYFIPTVIHVVHTDLEDELPFSDIEFLINHVNLGLRGLSDNNTVSRPIFDSLWADTEIQLCLATEDANGLATNGIVYKYVANPIQPGDFFRIKGESLPWDTDQYLNIWLCFMGEGSDLDGGVTTSPTVPHSNFPNPYIGVMLNMDCYNPAQILIHEVGHFFGLKHLYTDNIDDTPCSDNSIDPEPACDPTFLTINTCSDEAPSWNGVDPPDMIENYMEYYGNCAKMFTKGQKTRIRSYANTYYADMLAAQSSPCELVLTATHNPAQAAVKLYPNPTSGPIVIEKPGLFRYQLFTVHGLLVQRASVQHQAEINMDALSPGMYVLLIEYAGGGSMHKIFKKNAN